jgi:hypothetical protein
MVKFLTWAKDFLIFQSNQAGSVANPASHSIFYGYQGNFNMGKEVEAYGDCLPLSSAKVKMCGSIPPLPHVAWHVRNNRDNINFTFNFETSPIYRLHS